MSRKPERRPVAMAFEKESISIPRADMQPLHVVRDSVK